MSVCFRPGYQRVAFSLVEVVIALGVVVFCIAAILSLFSVGLRNSRDSAGEMRAASLASSLLARLRANPHGDLTAEGFPFGALTNSGGTLFQYDAASPRYIKGNGLTTANAQEALVSGGCALLGQGSFDPVSKVATVSFTLWWPAAAPFNRASGKYSVSTYIDTEAP
jgi:type II secretory pathway pseudopilin PulG